MRSECGRRRAGAILGRVIPAFRRAAVAARSSVGALHHNEARPVAAERAAQGLQLALPSAVVAEVRWAFTPPRSWLSGVAANLVLALVWLLAQPLHLPRHHDWVILIGTYFSSFILADVTTTNMLGADHIRVAQGVARRGSALACAAGEEPGAGRGRRTADPCRGDGHDVVARNTRTARGDDSQRRGADCVLARGRKPGVGAVSCRRRATDPSLGTTPRPSRHDQVDCPPGVAVRLVLRRRPYRRHRARLLLASGSAGDRSDIGWRESQFRPHRHRGGRLGYCDRGGGAVLLGARPSDRGDPEIG